MNNRTFKGKLSFNAADLTQRNHLSIERSGLSMPIPKNLEEYRKDFYRAQDWLSFGWSGNDPKFYGEPHKDVAPKAEDFVEVPFRLISATIVGGGTWKATDFSNVAVLKKSTKMLDGKTIYKDHETDTDNWVGIVNGVKWTEAFSSNGTPVPAGIDGILAIDKITNPKVARGALMGTIYSNSVTVEFDWEMSHQFENEWDFLSRIGTLGTDGKMIRRVVTAIHNYHETSLVWLGADPFAKAYDTDNNLKNIDVGSVYKFCKATPEETAPTDDVKKDYQTSRVFSVGLGFDKDLIPISKMSKNELDLPPQNKKDMKNFLAAFISVFGAQLNLKMEDVKDMKEADELVPHLQKIVIPEGADPAVTAQFSAVRDLALAAVKKETPEATTVDLAEFTKTHTFIKTEELNTLTEANKGIAELTKEANIGKTYLSAKRTEAIRLYKVAVGEDKVSADVIAMFEKAEDAAVEGLLKQYAKDATMKFSGKCGKCGSSEFEFKSSFEPAATEETANAGAVKVGFNDILKEVRQPKSQIGRGRSEEK